MIKISKAIIEKDGEYLLLKRSDDSSYPGMWDFAGGKDDPGEAPEQSVVRDINRIILIINNFGLGKI